MASQSSSPSAGPGSSDTVADRGGSMTALVWVETSLCIIVIALRIWSRKLTASMGLDDWSILLATVTYTILSPTRHHSDVVQEHYLICFTGLYDYQRGYSDMDGKHWRIRPRMEHHSPRHGKHIVCKSLYQCTQTLSVITSKFSVGYLILRLMPVTSKWQRRAVWAVTLFTVAHNSAAIITNW